MRLLLLPLLAAGCLSSDASKGGDSSPSDTADTADTASDCLPDPYLQAACFCDGPVARLGDGLTPFAPLTEGQPVTLVHGPQGGWHILASVEVTGAATMEKATGGTSAIVQLFYAVDLLPEEARVVEQSYRVELAPTDACTGTYWNMYGYLDVTALADGDRDTPPELLVGRDLRMTMEVTDLEGRASVAQVTVLGAPDPSDVDSLPKPHPPAAR